MVADKLQSNQQIHDNPVYNGVTEVFGIWSDIMIIQLAERCTWPNLIPYDEEAKSRALDHVQSQGLPAPPDMLNPNVSRAVGAEITPGSEYTHMMVAPESEVTLLKVDVWGPEDLVRPWRGVSKRICLEATASVCEATWGGVCSHYEDELSRLVCASHVPLPQMWLTNLTEHTGLNITLALYRYVDFQIAEPFSFAAWMAIIVLLGSPPVALLTLMLRRLLGYEVGSGGRWFEEKIMGRASGLPSNCGLDPSTRVRVTRSLDLSLLPAPACSCLLLQAPASACAPLTRALGDHVSLYPQNTLSVGKCARRWMPLRRSSSNGPPLPTSLGMPSPSHRPWCHVAGRVQTACHQAPARERRPPVLPRARCIHIWSSRAAVDAGYFHVLDVLPSPQLYASHVLQPWRCSTSAQHTVLLTGVRDLLSRPKTDPFIKTGRKKELSVRKPYLRSQLLERKRYLYATLVIILFFNPYIWTKLVETAGNWDENTLLLELIYSKSGAHPSSVNKDILEQYLLYLNIVHVPVLVLLTTAMILSIGEPCGCADGPACTSMFTPRCVGYSLLGMNFLLPDLSSCLALVSVLPSLLYSREGKEHSWPHAADELNMAVDTEFSDEHDAKVKKKWVYRALRVGQKAHIAGSRRCVCCPSKPNTLVVVSAAFSFLVGTSLLSVATVMYVFVEVHDSIDVRAVRYRAALITLVIGSAYLLRALLASCVLHHSLRGTTLNELHRARGQVAPVEGNPSRRFSTVTLDSEAQVDVAVRRQASQLSGGGGNAKAMKLLGIDSILNEISANKMMGISDDLTSVVGASEVKDTLENLRVAHPTQTVDGVQDFICGLGETAAEEKQRLQKMFAERGKWKANMIHVRRPTDLPPPPIHVHGPPVAFPLVLPLPSLLSSRCLPLGAHPDVADVAGSCLLTVRRRSGRRTWTTWSG